MNGHKMGPKPNRKQFVLVFWFNSCETSVIPLKDLKGTVSSEGEEAEASWRVNKKVSWHRVKVLKISDSEKELRAIEVDTLGNIIEDHQRGFSSSVLAKRRLITEYSKSVAKNQREAEADRQEGITNMPNLYSDSSDQSEASETEDNPINRKDDNSLGNRAEGSSKACQINFEDPSSLPDSSGGCPRCLSSSSLPMNKALFQEVSLENINFLQSVVDSLKVAYEWQVKSGKTKVPIVKVPETRLSDGPGKEEIYPGWKVYLPTGVKAAIELKGRSSWRVLVTSALVEIYGEQLHLLSALGTRGTIQGVDNAVLEAILDWGSSVSGKNLRTIKSEVVKHINKLCHNRRRKSGGNKPNKKKLQKKSACTDPPDSSPAATSTPRKSPRKSPRLSTPLGAGVRTPKSTARSLASVGETNTPRKSPRLAAKTAANPSTFRPQKLFDDASQSMSRQPHFSGPYFNVSSAPYDPQHHESNAPHRFTYPPNNETCPSLNQFNYPLNQSHYPHNRSTYPQFTYVPVRNEPEKGATFPANQAAPNPSLSDQGPVWEAMNTLTSYAQL